MKNIILDERPDVVVNFCGTALPDTKLCEMVSVNVGITTNILHAEYGTASGSQISELAECHPKTGYGITKYQQTVFGLDMSRRIPNTVVFLRPFNLLGCNMPPTTIAHLLWEKARQCKDGDTMTLFFPENIRDFIGVEDVAAAAWSVIESKPESGVFNVCSGEAKSLREVCESMLSALGIQATILQDPQYVGQQTAIDRIVGDGTKIMNACGWTAANSLDPVFRELAANNE